MLRPLDLDTAVEDLKKHSLAPLNGEIARLVYLAATRDYNTGKYYHDGLSVRFTPEIASQALAECHQHIFQKMVETPLKELVDQLEEYIRGDSGCSTAQIVSTWMTLESYRVIIPLACDPLSAKLFCSNFMIALAILESRAKNRLEN
jgi:hypothetical protein